MVIFERIAFDRGKKYRQYRLYENGTPKPEFEMDEDHSSFITRLFVQEEFLKEGVDFQPQNQPQNQPH